MASSHCVAKWSRSSKIWSQHHCSVAQHSLVLELIPLTARESRGWSPIMEERDSYDYLGEYGNDDSDRDMMQESLNSVIEKNIEDG